MKQLGTTARKATLRRGSLRYIATFAVAFGLVACATESGDGGAANPNDVITPVEDVSPGGGGVAKDKKQETPAGILDSRSVDYASALRLAAIKLVGELPTSADLKAFEASADKKAAYVAQVDKWIADPRFASTMIGFWRDTFKTGGAAPGQGMPSLDTAATFAAMNTVQDKSYLELFTASTGTCPTFANGAFAPADCAGASAKVGVITDPGLQAQYFANMAFRRVRFLQETFACSKFPAEYSATPVQKGNALFISPWKFESIAGKVGKPDARIDFQDTSAVVCANCHTTMNHIAPLFLNFDDKGAYNPTAVQVKVPVPGSPAAKLDDYLPAGEPLSWRNGKPTPDLPALGKAMAEDEDVARCAVTRAWNYGFSRGNVVDDVSPVSKTISDVLLVQFKSGGFKFKSLVRAVLTSDDFVKF
jgi:Protein of unknown function (DUF1549)